ncbi:MAG: hypothetical protein ACHQ49_12340 [Elusimicrobiota bacterium]
MRPDTAPSSYAKVSSPFARARPDSGSSATNALPENPPTTTPSEPAASAPAPDSAPAGAPAPDAAATGVSFAAAPHSVVAAPASKASAGGSSAPSGQIWTFEGIAFDLLTARGVFGAKLLFLDPEGDVVAQTDTGPSGRYSISIPAGKGYALKVLNDAYSDRYIDGGGEGASLRDASPDRRRGLLASPPADRPWRGDPNATVSRDLALIPRGR